MNEDPLQQGLRHQQAGQLVEAERIYRSILKTSPQNSDAWHFLGLIGYEVRNYAGAIDCISRAIQLRPEFGAYHSNLGLVYLAQKDFPHAIASLRSAVELAPRMVEAH